MTDEEIAEGCGLAGNRKAIAALRYAREQGAAEAQTELEYRFKQAEARILVLEEALERAIGAMQGEANSDPRNAGYWQRQADAAINAKNARL
jgi:hypothetical protein